MVCYTEWSTMTTYWLFILAKIILDTNIIKLQVHSRLLEYSRKNSIFLIVSRY